MKIRHILAGVALWVGFFSLPVLQTGCTSAPETRVAEVQTLKAVGLSAKTAMDAATTLLKQNSITLAQWMRVADLYDHEFQPAYRVAVNAVQSDLAPASPQLINVGAQIVQLVASYHK